MAVIAVALNGRLAWADGAFPDSQSILTPEAAPETIILSTNFGLIYTADGGRSWLWTCEQADNSFGDFYQVGPAPGFRVFAVSTKGLVHSDDRGCGWTAATGFGNATVSDYFLDPSNASRVLAIVATAGDGGIVYQVLESADAGATFGPVRYGTASGDNLTGLEIARTSAGTIYLSLTSGPSFAPKLVRSTDGGMNWRSYDLGPSLAAKTNSIQILAVDRADANKVFLRVRSPAGDAVAVSTFDAAGNVSTALRLTLAAGVLTAFTELANGHVIAGGVVGTDSAAYRSTDGGMTFQPLPKPPSLKALSSRGETVYAVADNVVDQYAIGTSTDEGMTWRPLLDYGQITAIDACVKQICEDDCLMRADIGQWSADFCSATAPPPSDAGSSSGGGGAAGAAGKGGTTGAPGKSGCHCAIDGDGSAAPLAGLSTVLVLAAAVRSRARRRGRAR